MSVSANVWVNADTKVICQVVYSTIQGDKVLTQATSTELTKYGVPCGHTNYAACYATGRFYLLICLCFYLEYITRKSSSDVVVEVHQSVSTKEFHNCSWLVLVAAGTILESV